MKRYVSLVVILGLMLAACSTEPAVPDTGIVPTSIAAVNAAGEAVNQANAAAATADAAAAAAANAANDAANAAANEVDSAAATAAAAAASINTNQAQPQPQPTSGPAANTNTNTNTNTITNTAPQPSITADQPVRLTGTFTYSNDIITTYYVEHAVALIDMYGFVKRDQTWQLPVDSQVLGYMSIDEQSKTGTFQIDLPERPRGTLVDVDNNGKQDTGVQVFVAAYSPNLDGGPFSDAYDPTRGWPSGYASTKNDSENKDEVIGGKLIVWAPDANQRFPTGFGPDGKLFTADDPEGPLPAGYSVINLDTPTFTISRNAEEKLTLYEPNDAAIKDFSSLSYTQAFQQMFQQVRTEYAFSDVPNKAPNWDQLYQTLLPRVQAAESAKDQRAFYLALNDFVLAFKDGHVSLGGGQVGQQILQAAITNGYGMALRELDDKSVVVVYVTPNGPAVQAGIQVGATITAFGGTPISQAIDAVQPLSGQFSTDFARRYQQVRYLTRAPAGTQKQVTFANPNGQSQTVQLTAVPDQQSFNYTSLFRGVNPNALPVEYQVTNTGIGYVKVNSNYDDLNLIIRLFERALRTFEQNQVLGIVIDMRQNRGGAPLGLAGYLTNQTITLGQLEYYSSKTKNFQPEGIPETVEPNPVQFKFNKMVLLVNQSCYSACEIDSYGFSKVPGMVVMGQYPTAGVEAEVSRGQFLLPNGLSLQVPTGRFKLPDGSLFLEGQGVQPTVRIPIDSSTVLASGDVVLQRAEQAITGP